MARARHEIKGVPGSAAVIASIAIPLQDVVLEIDVTVFASFGTGISLNIDCGVLHPTDCGCAPLSVLRSLPEDAHSY